jgi:hypothetical protein
MSQVKKMSCHKETQMQVVRSPVTVIAQTTVELTCIKCHRSALSKNKQENSATTMISKNNLDKVPSEKCVAAPTR